LSQRVQLRLDDVTSERSLARSTIANHASAAAADAAAQADRELKLLQSQLQVTTAEI
jgi:hypothetical protein